MADKARFFDYKSQTWVNILASEASITHVSRKIHYKCANPLCTVDMYLTNASDSKRAAFSSYPGQAQNHTGIDCIRSGIRFTESKYDESMFNTHDFFRHLLNNGKAHRTYSRANTSRSIAVSKNLPIRSLLTAYQMCISVGTDGFYNNVSINDLFAGESNYSIYQNGISGNKIVECSFYYVVYGKQSIILNYPIFNGTARKYVKIEFNDKELFFTMLPKIKASKSHREPIIIAGNWTSSNDKSYLAKCAIKSSKQICFPHY